jgi:hypothetical protein
MEGELTRYVQYENSDCLNGAVIRIPNGNRLLKEIASHHYLVMTGHNRTDIETIAPIFGLSVKVIE